MKDSLHFSLAAFLVCFASSLVAQDPRFILLKSGNVLEGKTTQFRDQTKIEFPNEDYLFVETEKIERTFLNWKDVFNYRAAVTPLERAAQERFLQWVIKHKNYDYAKQHLRELGSTDVEIDFEKWNRIISQRLDANAILSRSQSSLYRDPQTVFANQVELHLVHGCGLAGCHGSKDPRTMKLVDPTQLADKAATNPNYENVTQAIKKVGKEVFLRHVSQKHGRLRHGMYPTATLEYLAIATWVNGSVSATSRQVLRPEPQIQTKLKSIPQISKLSKSSEEKSDYKISSQSQLVDAKTQSEFKPRDEFDPEIFNRLQEQKWGKKEEPADRQSFNGQVPERLISPAATASRK